MVGKPATESGADLATEGSESVRRDNPAPKYVSICMIIMLHWSSACYIIFSTNKRSSVLKL